MRQDLVVSQTGEALSRLTRLNAWSLAKKLNRVLRAVEGRYPGFHWADRQDLLFVYLRPVLCRVHPWNTLVNHSMMNTSIKTCRSRAFSLRAA